MTKIIFNRQEDEIAIIAPSSGCQNAREKLQAGVKLLTEKGFKCKYDENILSANSDLSYFASSREQRAGELKKAILDPKVKIIWAFRGGYGASEIVFDIIDLPPDKFTPKIMIGFSDITALLILFEQKFKMVGIHSAGINSLLEKQSAMLEPILSVLAGADIDFALAPLKEVANKNLIKGQIVGGNLAVICHLIGSKLTLKTEEKIIFLEDVNEKGYHVHRYLLQMKNAGLFDKAKALILGDFSDSDAHLEASIQSFCREHLQIPVFRTHGIGHLPENYPVIIGGMAQIMGNKLTIASPFGLV